jgi:protein TonB
MKDGRRPDFSAAPSGMAHSGPYLLIALALHAAVLFYPLKRAVSHSTLLNPAPSWSSWLKSLSSHRQWPLHPRRRNRASHSQAKPKTPTPRQIIAVTAAPSASPAVVSVPTQLAAPPTPVAAVPGPATPAAVSAARFDAAYLQNPQPPYPSMSRRLGEEGKVLLKVRVLPDGNPASVDVEKSSSFGRLDEAARQAVARWRFVPAKRGTSRSRHRSSCPLSSDWIN